jgi:hypothetical protein
MDGGNGFGSGRRESAANLPEAKGEFAGDLLRNRRCGLAMFDGSKNSFAGIHDGFGVNFLRVNFPANSAPPLIGKTKLQLAVALN